MYRERGVVFDPEGLLSTLPATVNVIAGYLTGKFLLEKGRLWGTVGILSVVGFFLCGAGCLWSLEFLINKKLWTSSFVMVTTGIDLAGMAVLYYGVEMRRWSFGGAILYRAWEEPLGCVCPFQPAADLPDLAGRYGFYRDRLDQCGLFPADSAGGTGVPAVCACLYVVMLGSGLVAGPKKNLP